MRLLLLLALGGCELVFPLGDNNPVAPDAGAPPTCTHGTPFGPGVPVALDTTDSVEAARFVLDRKIVYLSLCTGGVKEACELYQGTYDAGLDQYGVFAKLEISDGDFYDSYPTITPDRAFIVFGSTRGTGVVQVYLAGSTNGQFTDPQALDVGTDYSNEPYLLGDGRTLYVSGGITDQPADLFRAVGTPPNFGTFEPVPGTSSMDQELAPVATDDELEIFFASNRQQPTDDLGLDIYTATRTSASVPFETPVPITAISKSTTIDWPLWISPDRCELYYINKMLDQATLFVTRR